MDIKITNIRADGDASKEYVTLHVDRDCDISDYILADTTYLGPDEVSNELRHMYWFYAKKVEAGDTIILRTGRGRDTEEDKDDGTVKHRFYWGLRSAVWNDTGDTAVLLRIADWRMRKAK